MCGHYGGSTGQGAELEENEPSQYGGDQVGQRSLLGALWLLQLGFDIGEPWSVGLPVLGIAGTVWLANFKGDMGDG